MGTQTDVIAGVMVLQFWQLLVVCRIDQVMNVDRACTRLTAF